MTGSFEHANCTLPAFIMLLLSIPDDVSYIVTSKGGCEAGYSRVLYYEEYE